jgi:hypothetical protein
MMVFSSNTQGFISLTPPSRNCESRFIGTKQSRSREVFLGKVDRKLKHKISRSSGAIIGAIQDALRRTI